MCLQKASPASALSPYRVRQPAKGPRHTVMLFKRLTHRICVYMHVCGLEREGAAYDMHLGAIKALLR